jgi:DNA-binding NtrC family response regulator
LTQLALRAAKRATTILITGETGTGKARLARSMHEAGSGPDAPFVVISCASLPEGLAESELFGHEADAFSGAAGRRAGRFELAQGGSVLLERVEDLPPAVQGKLLRVLQERTFERVGGNRSLRMDARVIATSAASLSDLVADGRFREDLYWRLDVVHLQVPPLRDRPEDVAELARAACEDVAEGRCRLSKEGVALLERQLWPGNVRQLRNVLERAAALAEAQRLGPDELEAALAETRGSPDRAIAELAAAGLSLSEIEALYIRRVLQQTGGRIGRAAGILGIHRKTLLDKRKRHGLD